MKACILKADPGSEYFADEQCHILELSNSAADEAVSVARARVEPGVTTKRHRVVDTAERYVIQSGTGCVMIDGQADAEVGPGDVVLIPPGGIQCVRNTGDTDLVFLCICTPRFRWENYETLE